MTTLNNPLSDESYLVAKLDEGLNSGPGIDADDGYWDRKQADLVRRANAARDVKVNDHLE